MNNYDEWKANSPTERPTLKIKIQMVVSLTIDPDVDDWEAAKNIASDIESRAGESCADDFEIHSCEAVETIRGS